ncbi:FAS1-like dehydratase domain-containing protein [Novosphingobium mangrovi (ex Huang et al. 2023)]|uniref:MaoC family dehydratase N-terminal domain-containing protein n=1 Tax=Novosphingobium mangrovi (ex Huang et al. 2023) TaxID=2976432 RepID=A0ABT2IB29_9SPHN|nr:MaoC family dehydratase N-terminal domain-containing protein [Novosphingobium mangrovi (ex Huang et al. 2023)]MCT2402011.1 MaoC family dehydratase N-terminal domain-containing protein [Novosphingobium mangrovi (ex Huang et al. 2023)]
MTARAGDHWQAWVAREEFRRGAVEAAAVKQWLATFDRDGPADASVPQAYHWCLFPPDVPTSKLGADGHPASDGDKNSFLPPFAQSRRMWAMSKIEFLSPLQVGQPVQRRSRVASITEKNGRSGSLVFVEIALEILSDGEVAVRETQSIVYREPVTARPVVLTAAVQAFDASEWDAHRLLVPSEPLLFRFSALTFNSHRIHYDRPYACEVEGYRGLVVHGPLIATLLLDLAQQQFGFNVLRSFECRAVSAAICGENLYLALRENGGRVQLVAQARDGRQIMVANGTL